MKTSFLSFFSLMLLASVAHAANVRVAATTGDLGAIAREVGGDRAEVQVLAPPTQDPHFADAKPSLVLQLARADLVLVQGVDLEVGWLPKLLTSARNAKIQPGNPGYLDCSTLVGLLEVPQEKVDRSMGDIHPGGNPHYPKDPRNAVRIAQGIAERLGKVDPDGAAGYLSRAKAFETRVLEREKQWQQALAPLKGAAVVTYHKSWRYFTAWAGLEEVAYVEPKPGIPPSAGHLTSVVGVMKAKGAKLILQEEWYPAGGSELLAKHSGARVVRLPGMAGLNQTYEQYLDDLVQRLTGKASAL